MNILEKESIPPYLLGILMYIKINSTKDSFIRTIIKEYVFEYENESGRKTFEVLEEMDLIKYIKGTKKNELWDTVRLSEKGEKILKELGNKPLHPLSEYMLECTKKEYERIGADKSYIQGGGKLLNYISEFLYSRKSNYTEKMIKAVVLCYVESFEQNYKYLNKMSTLFFKPKNVYNTKFNIEESPLHNFIENNIEKIKYYHSKL